MQISEITVYTNLSDRIALAQGDNVIELTPDTVELVVKAMRKSAREIKEDS